MVSEQHGRVARAAARLGLRSVVVTSVTRDDLADGGAAQFAAVAAARLGARVALVENLGMFGGVATASLVNIWHSTFDTKDQRDASSS